ncbi:hypothetical protein RGC40_02595 [Helicobacter pylori]|nr:hypothetical protein [Helicobacter pylori]MDU9786704.1 hypothetical protein [Helicobacter pylori]
MNTARYNTACHLFLKRGRNGIQSFNHSIIQSFNHSIIQSSNAIAITFTKTNLKIPYFLLFPLSLTRATFLKNLIR